MKISIIIATLNSEHHIKRALDSIWRQNFHDYEVLIADGGSTDKTMELIQFHKTSNLRWVISEKDSGVYEAWNKAIEYAKGEWILFLGSDDELAGENVLQNFSLISNKISCEFSIIYGSIERVLDDGSSIIIGNDPWPSVQENLYIKGRMMPHQGVFHSINLFSNMERFDSRFKISGDYDFLLRTMKNRTGFLIDGFIVAKMYFGGLSSRFNDFSLHHENMRARKKNLCQYNRYIFFLQIRYYIREIFIKIIGLPFTKKINSYFSDKLKH